MLPLPSTYWQMFNLPLKINTEKLSKKKSSPYLLMEDFLTFCLTQYISADMLSLLKYDTVVPKNKSTTSEGFHARSCSCLHIEDCRSIIYEEIFFPQIILLVILMLFLPCLVCSDLFSTWLQVYSAWFSCHNHFCNWSEACAL